MCLINFDDAEKSMPTCFCYLARAFKYMQIRGRFLLCLAIMFGDSPYFENKTENSCQFNERANDLETTGEASESIQERFNVFVRNFLIRDEHAKSFIAPLHYKF